MILKSEVLTFVNSVLRRNETNIDEQIQIVVDDLAAMHVLTDTDDTQSFDNADFMLDYPTDALETEEAIISVTLTVNGYRSKPLTVIPGGWQEYLRKCSGNLTAARSVVYEMLPQSPYIYLLPPPSQSGTASIYYYKRHSAVGTTLDFSDPWKNCIKFGAASQVAAKYGLNSYNAFTAWDAQYQREKVKQKILAG
jgi:hypothetical protein